MTTTATKPPVATAPVYISEYVVRNWMGLAGECYVNANGGHVAFSGPNASGKTSAISGIRALLGVLKPKDLPEAIHHGADDAEAEAKLTDGTKIHLRVKPGNIWDWSVTLPNGAPARKPADFIKALGAQDVASPGDFLDLGPREQANTLLKVYKVPCPVPKVKEIMGSAWRDEYGPVADESASAWLRRLAEDNRGMVYMRRRELNGEMTRKRAALEEKRAVLPITNGAAPPPESIKALLAKRTGLQAMADVWQAKQAEARDAKGQLAAGKKHLDGLRGQRQRLGDEMKDLEEQIETLRQRLFKKTGEAADLDTKIDRFNGEIGDYQSHVNSLEADAKALPDPSAELAELDRQIAAAEASSAERVRWEAAREEVARLESEWKDVAELHGKCDLILAGLRDLGQNLLNDAELDIKGLSVADGELRLNGVLLQQASGAERELVASAVLRRQNPHIRVLVMDSCEKMTPAKRKRHMRDLSKDGWQWMFAFAHAAACVACDGEGDLKGKPCKKCNGSGEEQTAMEVKVTERVVAA